MTLPINFEYLAECVAENNMESTYIICLGMFSFILGGAGIMMLLNYLIFAGPVKTVYNMYKDLLDGFSIAGGAVIGFFFSAIYILFYIALAITVIFYGALLWINIFNWCIEFFVKHSYTII